MRTFKKLADATVEGLLDRPMYLVIWQCRATGDVNVDGDTHFLGMTRARAIEACQSLMVLRVFKINLGEGTQPRDVTEEVMAAAGLVVEEAA